MHNPDYDSAFARALLTESSHTPSVNRALSFTAPQLSKVVLAPIIHKLSTGGELTAEENATIEFLANEHSKEGLQWGAVLPDVPKAEILSSPKGKLYLVTELAKRLSPDYIENIRDEATLAGVMKAMTDCGFCYVEKLNSLHSPGFERIKNTISPTPEELAIRVTRKEMGQREQVAISFGIGTRPGVDISPKDEPVPVDAQRRHNAGKSVFGAADTMERVKLVVKAYDEALAKFNQLDSEFESMAYAQQDSPSLEARRNQAEQELKLLADKMKFYKIPLDPSLRSPDLSAHQPPKPSIEKLAEWGGSPGKLPLVATASGTTARTLIALQDIGALSPGERFNPELAQYVSSTLCGTIVGGGHHSVLEVGEMYNRLLDYNAIEDLDKRHIMRREEDLPYYEIGDSFTLVPREMREGVAKTMTMDKFKGQKSELASLKPSSEESGYKPPDNNFST